jgi:hypothetical protein
MQREETGSPMCIDFQKEMKKMRPEKKDGGRMFV